MTVSIEPWSVWWIEFDPVEGREQAGRRPGLVVSSRFQLTLTAQTLIAVLPLTTRHRPGWEHRVPVTLPEKPPSFVLTEQIRTVSRTRFAGNRPLLARIAPEEIREIRAVLRQVLDL